MQRRLVPETGVNEPFENVSRQGHIQKFFQGGGNNFRHFFKRSFFPAELIYKQLKYQKRLKIVENLHTV